MEITVQPTVIISNRCARRAECCRLLTVHSQQSGLLSIDASSGAIFPRSQCNLGYAIAQDAAIVYVTRQDIV